jgi:hypothetical protein
LLACESRNEPAGDALDEPAVLVVRGEPVIGQGMEKQLGLG